MAEQDVQATFLNGCAVLCVLSSSGNVHDYLVRFSGYLSNSYNSCNHLALAADNLHKADIQKHKLVVTGSDPVSVEITSGYVHKRQDMATTLEEGGILNVQRVSLVEVGTDLVVADETSIFTVCWIYVTSAWKCPGQQRNSIKTAPSTQIYWL